MKIYCRVAWAKFKQNAKQNNKYVNCLLCLRVCSPFVCDIFVLWYVFPIFHLVLNMLSHELLHESLVHTKHSHMVCVQWISNLFSFQS